MMACGNAEVMVDMDDQTTRTEIGSEPHIVVVEPGQEATRMSDQPTS